MIKNKIKDTKKNCTYTKKKENKERKHETGVVSETYFEDILALHCQQELYIEISIAKTFDCFSFFMCIFTLSFGFWKLSRL